jgi:hypothetical protein
MLLTEATLTHCPYTWLMLAAASYAYSDDYATKIKESKCHVCLCV